MPGTTQRPVYKSFYLNLDGKPSGFLHSMEGGGISAEVIEEPSSNLYFTKKHIGQPRYEDCLLEIGFSLTKTTYEWIRGFWHGNSIQKPMTIFTLDNGIQVKSQRDFVGARLVEVTMPALDAGSKEPGYITVRVASEFSRSINLPGKLTIGTEYRKSEPQTWLPSNFKLEINGLDCTKVNKVDAFTVKQTQVAEDPGGGRDSINPSSASKLEFPNLKITLAESSAQTWIDWFDDFVINGNNGEAQEKAGCITFLNPNREQQPLARVDLFNLGIFRLTPQKAQTGVDQISRLVAELYCERMVFEYGGKIIA